MCVSHCHLYHSYTVDPLKKFIVIQIPQHVHTSVQQGILEVTHMNTTCLWLTALSRGSLFGVLHHLKHCVS